jgi:hypothetical protein
MPWRCDVICDKSKKVTFSMAYDGLRRLDTPMPDQYGARDFEGILNILRSGQTGQAR